MANTLIDEEEEQRQLGNEALLINFHKRLDLVLHNIYDSRRVLFRKYFRIYLIRAFSEIETNLEIMGGALSDPPAKLIDRGLNQGGAQLDFKLAALFESYNDYDYEGGVWNLKKFLKYAKMILGSLGDLIPGAEIIKEFIEAVEMGIEDAERNDRRSWWPLRVIRFGGAQFTRESEG